MRRIIELYDKWAFTKENVQECGVSECEFEEISLPHTWNNLDGQDGGLDYYRGVCWYKRTLTIPEEEKGKQVYLEFEGVNSIAEVMVNKEILTRHEGGFSTFRINITEAIDMDKDNEILVSVDNRQNDYVYPQTADFTFYGGIYRKVNLILVEESHFELDDDGSKGIKVTTNLQEEHVNIVVEAMVSNLKEEQVIQFDLYSKEGQLIESKETLAATGEVTFKIEKPHLWNGVKDPYLYEVKASLIETEIIDSIATKFGVRSFKVDPEKGFILNGEIYPLRGVSRHQDRENKGWAITEKEHKEDIELIVEVGANTIRLAHYQHDAYFYDLCDEYGIVVWAEIPFISSFMQNGYRNTISQMKELIKQNYNHPSICFWGISNEITMGGEPDELEKNLIELHEMTHQLDSTRLTTIANASMTKLDSKHNQITDVVAYNHYYGWYGGDVNDNSKWFDEFHKIHPEIPIALSEYGAESILKYHSNTPKIRDYTEEYQTYYHEKMLEFIEERPYLWATYVWNMFDFGADGRDEGGEKGRNHKGLITYDRETKKDSFYIYKAYWSDESFVHICGRRFYDRVGETTNIKVYSNCNTVQLSMNDKVVAKTQGNKVFDFQEVPMKMGENTITVIGFDGDEEKYIDHIVLHRALEANDSYVYTDEFEGDGADNWFVEKEDGTIGFFEFPVDYMSINDTLEQIMSSKEGVDIMMNIISQTPVQGNQRELLDYLKDYTVKGLMVLTSGKSGSLEKLLDLNEILNKIPKNKQ